MTASSKVRIGFVGVGRMGQCAHLRNYANLPDVRVVALAELRPRLARQVADRYGVPRVYASAAEMLAHEQLDGLVVPQMFTHHGSIVPPLCRAGIPILTEKPLASSLAAGRAMLEALDAGGSWHMVAYHKRCDPATVWVVNEIRRLRQTGEAGAMRYVRITMPPGDWAVSGFSDLIESDEPLPQLDADPRDPDVDETYHKQFTSFLNYYIHQVNLLRHLLGEPYEVTYAAPSGVLLVAQTASGVTGTIEMAPYQTTTGWEESAMIGFDRGRITLNLPAPLTHNRAGEVEVLLCPKAAAAVITRPQLPPLDAMRQQAAHFVRAIRGEVAPSCDAHEAMQDMVVARQYMDLRFASHQRK